MSFHDKVHPDVKLTQEGDGEFVVFGWFFTEKGSKRYLSQTKIKLSTETPQELTNNNLW
jgi:hypothetical protein